MALLGAAFAKATTTLFRSASHAWLLAAEKSRLQRKTTPYDEGHVKREYSVPNIRAESSHEVQVNASRWPKFGLKTLPWKAARSGRRTDLCTQTAPDTPHLRFVVEFSGLY